MKQIDNLSDDINQLSNIILDDGSVVALSLVYRPAIQRWSASIKYDLFENNGLIICMHPNLLRPWRNLIPFGLACTTDDHADPIFFDDFSTGRSILYILDASEVQAIEDTIFGAGL